MAKTLGSRLPGFCSFQPNTQLHGRHCQEGMKSPWPGFHHWEAGVNTGWVMGRKAVSCRERGQFSAPWHLGEASRDGWAPLKVLPSCRHENLPARMDAGGWEIIVKTVSTILMASDLFLACKSGRSGP